MRAYLGSVRFGMTALVLSVLTVGCGGGGEVEVPTGEVAGTVTLNGEPFAEGSISLYSEETGNSVGGAVANGEFKFTEAVPVGKYLVAIQPPDEPQPDDESAIEQARAAADIIPDGYRDGSTSGLVATIAEGPNSLKFELSNDGPSQTPGDESPP